MESAAICPVKSAKMNLRYQPVYKLPGRAKNAYIEDEAYSTIEEAEQAVIRQFAKGSRHPIISWYIMDLQTKRKLP